MELSSETSVCYVVLYFYIHIYTSKKSRGFAREFMQKNPRNSSIRHNLRLPTNTCSHTLSCKSTTMVLSSNQQHFSSISFLPLISNFLFLFSHLPNNQIFPSLSLWHYYLKGKLILGKRMDFVNTFLNWIVPPASMVMLACAWPALCFINACEWLYNSLNSENMDDKVVIITGASSGIGEVSHHHLSLFCFYCNFSLSILLNS